MSYKVTIELEFDTHKPDVKDILQYIKELGEDLGYEIEDRKKERTENGQYE